jgi:hypothetical protein
MFRSLKPEEESRAIGGAVSIITTINITHVAGKIDVAEDTTFDA